MVKLVFIFIFFELLSCQVNNRNRICHEFNQNYSAIIRQMNNKVDTSKLVSALNKMAQKDSLCKDIYLTRGDIFLASDGLLKLAKQDYQKCLILDSNNIYSLYKLGLVYQIEDAYDSSIYYFQKALNKKSYKTAVIDYHSNSNLNSDISKYDVESNSIIFRLGESYYYKGDLQLALINFDFCISNNFLLSKSYLYRGSIHLESNRKEKACNDFKLALENGNIEAATFIKKYCNIRY